MIIVVLVLMAAPGLDARNVDLVTLPRRDSVQLTIYNSADITMAKETRHITLTKGVNRLQFSWANTLIDPTSVEIRPIEHADEIEIIDTIFPAQKPQHLIWNIESEYEGQVAMRDGAPMIDRFLCTVRFYARPVSIIGRFLLPISQYVLLLFVMLTCASLFPDQLACQHCVLSWCCCCVIVLCFL